MAKKRKGRPVKREFKEIAPQATPEKVKGDVLALGQIRILRKSFGISQTEIILILYNIV